jgi:drug/metabolite transporter (DMT)-like permease
MRADLKGGIEYGVITLLAVGLCLWLLISGGQEPDPSPAKITLAALGALVAWAMHCVFMMQLVRRTGRPFWPWFLGILLMPLGSAVLLATLLGESEASES